MRIIDMRPEITPWKDGQSRKVGKWSFTDTTQPIGAKIRQVFHYNTLMLEFVGLEYEFDKERGEITHVWSAEPVSIGLGSVSDQGGMNQLMAPTYRMGPADDGMYRDYGYRYYRDIKGGGPRIEDMHGTEVL